MKKISILSVLCAFALPAFGEESASLSGQYGEMDGNSKSQTMLSQKYSNPETRFPRGLQFGVGLSPTSGLNGFIGYNNKKFDSFWAKRFGIRFDFAGFSPIKNRVNQKVNNMIGNEGIEIEDDLKIENVAIDAKHYGAMVDFYPFGDTWFLGGWRLSGGYMFGNLQVSSDIHGKSVDNKIEFELNDVKYYYESDEMHAMASFDWKYSGPYVGTGFDLGLFWGIKIYMDAGVVFADKAAKVDLDVPLTDLKDGDGNSIADNDSLTTLFNENKNAQIDKVQKELDKYPYYPLVKLGFMYRF